MEAETTGLYVIVGGFVVKEIGATIVAGVRWWAARAMKREEEAQEAESNKLEKVDELVRTVMPKLESIGESTGQLRGGLDELRAHVKERLEEQGKFYREKLAEVEKATSKQVSDLEYNLRRDMTRAISDQGSSARARKKL